MKTKKHFTLIEVLIAFGLVAILIAVVMGFYVQFSQMQAQGAQVRQQAFRMRYAQKRLTSVLSRATNPGKKSLGTLVLPNTLFFSTDDEIPGIFKSPSLVFSYENEPDLNANFCGEVLGRLYWTQEGGLWLATWPRPSCSQDATLGRRELLLDHVEGLSFEFFEPMEATETTSDDHPRPQPGTWNRTWSIDYRELPALVKISVKLPDEELVFHVPLPNSNKVISILP